MDLNKDRLRAAYDEAVSKIGAERNGLLNGPLYKQMHRLVFDTAYAAHTAAEVMHMLRSNRGMTCRPRN